MKTMFKILICLFIFACMFCEAKAKANEDDTQTPYEIKGYWENSKECIPIIRCATDLECEQRNPGIKEGIEKTHKKVKECGEIATEE